MKKSYWLFVAVLFGALLSSATFLSCSDVASAGGLSNYVATTTTGDSGHALIDSPKSMQELASEFGVNSFKEYVSSWGEDFVVSDKVVASLGSYGFIGEVKEIQETDAQTKVYFYRVLYGGDFQAYSPNPVYKSVQDVGNYGAIQIKLTDRGADISNLYLSGYSSAATIAKLKELMQTGDPFSSCSNCTEIKPYDGYIVPGTYKSTNTTGAISTLTLTQTTITWNDTLYSIIAGQQWSTFSTTGKPNQFTYLVSDGTKRYYCCVMYYINNTKDYVKFYAPKETDNSAIPSEPNYSLVGSLSKALTMAPAWEVLFTNPTTEGTVKVAKSDLDNSITVVAGGKTWKVDYQTWVKNFDLSMPCGDDRMEMHVDSAVWLSSSHNSPRLLSLTSPDPYMGDAGYGWQLEYSYPLPANPVFYELQCCESYGMYLLSVTAASLEYDEDEDDYYFTYSVVENLTLTKDQFDSLMIHFN